MLHFVVHTKQEGEITNAYSLVDDDVLKLIPKEAIHAVKAVEERLYTKEEMEALRDSIL